MAGVLARKVAVLASVLSGVGPVHPWHVGGVLAFVAVVRLVDPHPSPPNAGT
jgi:hypothetical protein